MESITIIKTNADSPAGENSKQFQQSSEQIYSDRPEKNNVKKIIADYQYHKGFQHKKLKPVSSPVKKPGEEELASQNKSKFIIRLKKLFLKKNNLCLLKKSCGIYRNLDLMSI